MSIWMEQQIKKVDELREKHKSQASKRYILTGVIFGVFLAIAVGYGLTHPGYALGASCGIIIGLGVFCEFMMFVNSRKVAKKEKLPRAQKCLKQLLMTPEQTQEFDNEMMSAPIFELKGDALGSQIFITEHYIGDAMTYLGEPDFTFARLSEIRMVKWAGRRDSHAVSPMEKVYYIDLCSADGKKLMGLTLNKRKVFQEFQEVLEKYCPGVNMKKC